MGASVVLAVELADAALALGVAAMGGLPAWAAVYYSNKANRRVEAIAPVVEATAAQVSVTGKQTAEMAPKVTAIDDSVNNRKPSDKTLRETAEATGLDVAVLKDQEAARVVERDLQDPRE